MNVHGLAMSDSESDTLFKHFDVDSSGGITYGEFAQGLRGKMPDFSASLAFMHQFPGHYPSNMSMLRAARPSFDRSETHEWIESLEAVVQHGGKTRARFLLHELMEEANRLGVSIAQPAVTPMVNSIPTSQQPAYPGDREVENKISNIIRWNAAVMVSDANKRPGGVGGHIGTFASICDFYEVGQKSHLAWQGLRRWSWRQRLAARSRSSWSLFTRVLGGTSQHGADHELPS